MEELCNELNSFFDGSFTWENVNGNPHLFVYIGEGISKDDVIQSLDENMFTGVKLFYSPEESDFGSEGNVDRVAFSVGPTKWL